MKVKDYFSFDTEDYSEGNHSSDNKRKDSQSKTQESKRFKKRVDYSEQRKMKRGE